MEKTQIALGDRVRIRSTEATESLGIAGLTGIVQGRTTPSVTGGESVLVRGGASRIFGPRSGDHRGRWA